MTFLLNHTLFEFEFVLYWDLSESEQHLAHFFTAASL
jgi:hypothetical protein